MTTVHKDCREELRVVLFASHLDSCEVGEEVARFASATSLTVVRKMMIAYAMEYRGIPVSIDLYSHKLIWERFVSVCYEPSWIIDPQTGIILEGREVSQISEADRIAAERARFESERIRRERSERQKANRGQKGRGRTATDH